MEQAPFQHENNGSRRSTRAGVSAEGFKGHDATDGSLLGNAGKVESMWLGSGTAGPR